MASYPRCFISYSWDNQVHKDWVRSLAEQLRMNGIDARLDEWNIKKGESLSHFMEQEIREADFVVAICTPIFAAKSNSRKDSVGVEQQIVSARILDGLPRAKFIPVIRSGDHREGENCALPTLFAGTVWVDFRDDAEFNNSLEALVRAILQLPKHSPPPISETPLKKTLYM